MIETPKSPTTPAQSKAPRLGRSRGSGAMPAVLMGLLLLAFALRVFLLDAQSIWWDEGISLHLAGSSLQEIFRDRLDNIHPPLYFLILKGWLALTGTTTFAARYLSVLAGWLQVPAVYAVAARWFGRRTGMVAAFLVAVSAVSIIYAQEVRVYSLLPLAYLALLAVTRELTQPGMRTGSRSWVLWALLGVSSWIALHLHYVSLFAVGYATAWALLSFLRARRWSDFWRVLFVQAIVLLASLPWFAAAVANRAAIQGEASAGTFVTEPVPLRFLLAQVWTFHLTGLPGALARPGVAAVAGAAALLLVLLLLIRLYVRETRRSTAVLLANWLIPLSSALLVWLVRSFSHPRYVAMFVPGLLLLAAYLILPGAVRLKSGLVNTAARVLALLLFAALTALALLGLALYFFDDNVAKDDVRGAARYLEQVTGPGDLILVPDTDWSLPFEYGGEALVAMPGLERTEDRWQNLSVLTVAAPRVYTLDYRRGTRDWQGLVPFALHKAGREIGEAEIDDLIVRGYELDQPLAPPDFSPESIQFGPLSLRGAWIEEGAPAGDALALALQWRVDDGQPGPPLHAALRLLDENGRIIASKDERLVDHAGRPSDQWDIGQTITTYHLLPLPPATPPLGYTLAVELYQRDGEESQAIDVLDEQGAPAGQAVLFPGIQTSRAVRPSQEEAFSLDDSVLDNEVLFASGLLLQDAMPVQDRVAAGMPLNVQLLWQAQDKLPDLQPRLALLQDGTLLAADDADPAGGRYPTSLWEIGEQVLEERVLRLPGDAAGSADLVLQLSNQSVDLGEIFIEPRAVSFEPPPMENRIEAQFGDTARLVGFDLAERVYLTDETISLTLLWQSLVEGSPENYVVFTHLLGEDGSLIGQHDGIPAQGARPLTGWVRGEYILDAHDLVFRERAYRGAAVIEVGLYDPASGERLRLPDGSDHVVLPVELTVGTPE